MREGEGVHCQWRGGERGEEGEEDGRQRCERLHGRTLEGFGVFYVMASVLPDRF